MGGAMCQVITVGGREVHCPSWLPARGWSIHSKGYVIYTSRKKQPLIRRGEFMHRVIIRVLAETDLDPEIHVHHQNNCKTFNCPLNLLAVPACMNPATAIRNPFNGQYMTADEYRRKILGEWKTLSSS
jgi:hypothetical protein